MRIIFFEITYSDPMIFEWNSTISHIFPNNLFGLRPSNARNSPSMSAINDTIILQNPIKRHNVHWALNVIQRSKLIWFARAIGYPNGVFQSNAYLNGWKDSVQWIHTEHNKIIEKCSHSLKGQLKYFGVIFVVGCDVFENRYE